MTERKHQSITTNEPTRIFILGGVKLLPHFLQKDTYVMPGSNKTYTSAELISMGAQPGWHNLWPRANLGAEEAAAELERMRTPVLIKPKSTVQEVGHAA